MRKRLQLRDRKRAKRLRLIRMDRRKYASWGLENAMLMPEQAQRTRMLARRQRSRLLLLTARRMALNGSHPDVMGMRRVQKRLKPLDPFL